VWRQLQLRCAAAAASALEGEDALQRVPTAQALDAADEFFSACSSDVSDDDEIFYEVQ
jgi:hypothetical protein